MIFHVPDKSYKRLVSCWKRANALGKPLPWWYEMFYDLEKHPLHRQFQNLVLAMDCDEPPDLVLLDWFAMQVDEYSKHHLLVKDRVARDLLLQWKAMMFIDPTKMT